MAKFTDEAGREWVVDLTVGKLKRVRQHCQADLLDAAAGLPSILEDPVRLADCLAVLLSDEIIAAGMTGDEFGERLRGEALEWAAEALIEAISDFSPPRARTKLSAMVQAMKAGDSTLTEAIVATCGSFASDLRERFAPILTAGP